MMLRNVSVLRGALSSISPFTNVIINNTKYKISFLMYKDISSHITSMYIVIYFPTKVETQNGSRLFSENTIYIGFSYDIRMKLSGLLASHPVSKKVYNPKSRRAPNCHFLSWDSAAITRLSERVN